MNRWEPIGSKTRGIGARYEVQMTTFGIPLEGVLRLNRWRKPDEIGWVSEEGLIKQEGGFTFTPVPDGVRIELRIGYEPPGGLVGAAVASRVDSTVRRRLEKALERIRHVLES